MQIKKSVEDLKDLESFEKKVLQDVEKQKREEAKNYLRLLTKGAESIWAWWHPSCLTSEFLTIFLKKISRTEAPCSRLGSCTLWYGYRCG